MEETQKANSVQSKKRKPGFMARLTKHPVIIAVVLIALMAVGFFVWRSRNQTSQQPQYQTSKVQKGTIISSVSASGNILATNVMNVETGASGIVETVYVKNGDAVTEGQPIIEIKLDQQGQRTKAQAYASYLAAKNNVESAEDAYYTLKSQRAAAKQMYQTQAVDASLSSDDQKYIQLYNDYQAAKAKYNNQQDVIDQAQAAADNAWLSYQSTRSTVVAPIAGTVNNLTLVEGMTVGSQSTASSQSSTSGQSSQSSQAIAVIQTPSAPIASVSLSEVDVSKVKLGQKATLTLDSISGKTFTGKVVNVDQVGSVTSGVTNYPALIQFDTTSTEILPNMAVSASVITATKTDALVVPSTAVKNQNDQDTVQVLKNKRVQVVTVQTGVSSDTQTEIVSGLSEGDEVVVGTSTNGTSGNSAFSSTGRGMFGMGGGPRD